MAKMWSLVAPVAMGGTGRDDLHGGKGNNTLVGDAGDDSAQGGSGADVIYGKAGADRLLGGAGTDQLRGGQGADRLTVGAGGDHLFIGNDTSQDRLIYNASNESPTSAPDFIHGFDRGEDVIDLRAIDARPARVDFNNTFAYSGNHSAAHSVWWTKIDQDVVVHADATGDGTPDLELQVLSVSEFGSKDFLL